MIMFPSPQCARQRRARSGVVKASELFRKELRFWQVEEASKIPGDSKQRKVFEITFPKRQRNQHCEVCFHTERILLLVGLLIFL